MTADVNPELYEHPHLGSNLRAEIDWERTQRDDSDIVRLLGHARKGETHRNVAGRLKK